ncbi:MAG TPA: hypothetical protein PK573_07620 [Spirochaetota bacterium]|nr:hypothetical protein [Spirochaetota bacterium]HRZ27580.1 hypothetical protein [Spirochaetota bacterium]HSA13469.1 hypothetical protein [Spirochaetota bacterium]
MITLKNGTEVEYNKDFDVFFQNLLEKVIVESRKYADEQYLHGNNKKPFNDLFLKEIMDNAIFIVHQLFEMSNKDKKMAEFVMTGFLFNSIVLALSKFDAFPKKEKDGDIIH